MRITGVFLVAVSAASMAIHRDTLAKPFGLSASSVECKTGLVPNDTARFTGIMVPGFFPSDPHPPGSLKLWADRDGRYHYAESWSADTNTFLWSGDIGTGTDGLPHSFKAQRVRNGAVVFRESIAHTNDSVVIVRDGGQTTERLSHDVVRVPGSENIPLLALLTQCALSRPGKEYRTVNYGMVRARELTTITVAAQGRAQPVSLFLLSADSSPQVAAVWLDARGRLFAARRAEGVMDLVAEGWEGSVDALVRAEAVASIWYPCKDIRPTWHFGGVLTMSDSGYTVVSDGRGPYADSIQQGRVLVGGIAALLFMANQKATMPRAFSVNLNDPVRGDIGLPLGVVTVTGDSSKWVTAEIAAQWITDSDFARHMMHEIPVGSTVFAQQLDIGFDINGVPHVLQMGPQPYDHCAGPGTAIYGTGTTRGTITRETSSRWVVDLPRGSIGRLFDNSRGSRNTVNKGLYHVSMHYVIQQ